VALSSGLLPCLLVEREPVFGKPAISFGSAKGSLLHPSTELGPAAGADIMSNGFGNEPAPVAFRGNAIYEPQRLFGQGDVDSPVHGRLIFPSGTIDYTH
jgi:hypothetical protein